MTQIAINEKQLVRIPAPYPSKCIDTWSKAGYSVVEENMPKLPYSIAVRMFFSKIKFKIIFIIMNTKHFFLQQCKRFCFSFMIIDQCSCFHPLYLDFPWMAGNSTLACNLETDSKKLSKRAQTCLLLLNFCNKNISPIQTRLMHPVWQLQKPNWRSAADAQLNATKKTMMYWYHHPHGHRISIW